MTPGPPDVLTASTAEAPAAAVRSSAFQEPFRAYAGLVAVLVGLVVLFGLLSEYFFTALTLRTLLNQIPPLLTVSVGMTFVLIIAGIDLSVGSVLALGGAVLGVAVAGGASVGVGALASIGVGLACGLANGAITVRWAVPSFIVTLGMLEVARGGAYLVTGSQTQYVGAAAEPLGAPLPLLGLSPAFLVALAVVAIGQVVLARTVWGRYMLAVGGNREAARLSGVRPGRIEVGVFAASGLLAGLGGAMQVGYLGSADPNAGLGLELAAIAAVVVGGTSLMGGRGSVVGTFIGVLIIAVLQVGLAQLGATEPTKRIVTGAVIVVAVVLDALRTRAAGRRYPLLARMLRLGRR